MGQVVNRKKLVLEDPELTEEEKKEIERRFYDFLEGKNIISLEEFEEWLDKELEE